MRLNWGGASHPSSWRAGDRSTVDILKLIIQIAEKLTAVLLRLTFTMLGMLARLIGGAIAGAWRNRQQGSSQQQRPSAHPSRALHRTHQRHRRRRGQKQRRQPRLPWEGFNGRL